MIWKDQLIVNPVETLLSSKNEAIEYFTRRDLLDEKVKSIKNLWKLPEADKMLRNQQDDGSWQYPGKVRENLRSKEDYNQLETYRILGQLIEKYGLNKDHQSIHKVKDYLFSCQTEEGDIRGILGNQYLPYYTGGFMELLIKAGYDKDPHIERGLKWLISMKQNDGGWAFPIRTHNINLKEAFKIPEPIQPDKTKPFSHLVTGMILRAFAAHPEYRTSEDGKAAGELFTSRFFEADKYPDRKDKKFWGRVSFPFWFTDIVSALYSLYYLGFTIENPQIVAALEFLRNKQDQSGIFDLKLVRGRDKDLPYWITLAVCRLFKNYYSK